MTKIPAASPGSGSFLHHRPRSRLRPAAEERPLRSRQGRPVQGRLGYQSMIEFGQGEQIENVAVGDSAAWQVTPNKRANLLFLKPLMGKARTNMTVVTDQRTYLFDLSVASSGNTPLYNLRFTYGATARGTAAAADRLSERCSRARRQRLRRWPTRS